MAKLFYMIGSVGAGKDSIVRYVRPRLDPRARMIFAHRYITRPDHIGSENFVYLTAQEFDIRRDAGLFVMQWKAGGYRYGVGKEIMDWLGLGFSVFIQGSREYLPEASRIMGDRLVPLLVNIEPEVLHSRLLSKLTFSEERFEEIKVRNERFNIQHPNLIKFENDGPLDLAGERLLSLLHAVTLAKEPVVV